MPEDRLCTVCGARIENPNPLVTTCSPLCTKIRNGKTTHARETFDLSQIPEDPEEWEGHGGLRQRKKFLHD